MSHGRKKWSRLEETEDILDQTYEVLLKLPLADLKRQEQLWLPSPELVAELCETKDRIQRYMKRNKLNGWSNDNSSHH